MTNLPPKPPQSNTPSEPLRSETLSAPPNTTLDGDLVTAYDLYFVDQAYRRSSGNKVVSLCWARVQKRPQT